MATRQANKRLQKEYLNIQKNPPPYITAHPTDASILEWHYLLTGPPDTPYHHGQYWGTLTFPPEYPFKPPAIRMFTPSGRFQTSTRLCLSISDFHPKSFNPAWEVSTILIGLLSFMTGEEMTTGSVRGSEEERRRLAERSRWWNSTGGGTGMGGKMFEGVRGGGNGGKVGLGDGGRRFAEEWPEEHKENLEILKREGWDLTTGVKRPKETAVAGGAVAGGVTKRSTGQVTAAGSMGKVATVQSSGAATAQLRRGESWIKRNRVWVGLFVVVGYVLLARALE